MSDMFKDLGEEAPKLELVVKVYNVNKGHNEELANRSVILKEYSIFIYLIREYAKSMVRDKAILNAIDDCVRHNVLKDFLREHSSEVYNLLLGDWDIEEAAEVRYEEGIAIGEARGENRGIVIGEARGIAIGRTEGETRGILRTARQMKVKGFNAAVISEITGLPEEEIDGL